jgi:hypothetical protein
LSFVTIYYFVKLTNFLKRNDLAFGQDFVSNITQKEGNNTNVIGNKLDTIKFRCKSIVTLTKNNQDTENSGKDTTVRVTHSFIRKVRNASTLTNISATETNMNTSNTSPTDETTNSSDTQEPNESLLSTKAKS